MSVLAARDLKVLKGDRTVLDGVSLELKPGSCTAILGENGAGKSVLLRTLALTEPQASGAIEVLGLRYQLGGAPPTVGPWPDLTIVLQSLALWPHLTARDNVRMPWRARDAAMRMTQDELDKLFAELEIDSYLRRTPAQLSGGQRQRVAIARALALKPKVLLLDEPSSALDARRASAVLNRLRRLKNDGTAIVCVTHNLGFAAKIADRYLFLHEGRKVEEEEWQGLMMSPSRPVQDYLALNTI